MKTQDARHTGSRADATRTHRILVWAQTSSGRPLAAATDEISYLRQLGADHSTALQVEVVENGFWSELPGLISCYRPTILHYIGHGRRGSLYALDRDSAGFPNEVEVSPGQFADLLRGASPSLHGVFLNGCETAHWAPHLIPRDGWIVGMNRTIDDHLAAEFSANFYTTLIEQDASETAFDTALREVYTHTHFEEGTFVRWVEDPDPDDFVHKVFSRQAFLTSTLDEGSLLDLGDALLGVRRALTTRGLALRNDLGKNGQVLCRTPLEKNLVTPLLTRLRVAEDDLRQLRRRFPNVVENVDAMWDVTPEEIPILLDLADRLDHSRNELLRIVNRNAPAHRAFRMINPTSMSPRWRGAT